jgi:hypothetical protein
LQRAFNKRWFTQNTGHSCVNGLAGRLKAAFSDIIPVQRPLVNLEEISDPNWLAGFTDGEGCFNITIFKSKTTSAGLAVKLRFVITQHSNPLHPPLTPRLFGNAGGV